RLSRKRRLYGGASESSSSRQRAFRALAAMDLRAPIWASTDLLMCSRLQVRRQHRSVGRVFQAKNLLLRATIHWTSGPEDAEGRAPGFRRFRQIAPQLSQECPSGGPVRSQESFSYDLPPHPINLS